MTWEFLGLKMKNFQDIIFIWIRTYREIFKSASVYLWCYQVEEAILWMFRIMPTNASVDFSYRYLFKVLTSIFRPVSDCASGFFIALRSNCFSIFQKITQEKQRDGI